MSGDKLTTSHLHTGDDLLAYIKTYIALDTLQYLIIDEAQYISNIGMILKTLIDDIRVGKRKIKLIVSGSGSLNVFKGMTDTLIGRKKIIHVFPFDFQEFCLIK